MIEADQSVGKPFHISHLGTSQKFCVNELNFDVFKFIAYFLGHIRNVFTNVYFRQFIVLDEEKTTIWYSIFHLSENYSQVELFTTLIAYQNSQNSAHHKCYIILNCKCDFHLLILLALSASPLFIHFHAYP